jgi:hypothetical protein
MVIVYSLICQLIAGLYFVFGGLLGLILLSEGIEENIFKKELDLKIIFVFIGICVFWAYPLIIEPLLDEGRL